MDRYPSSTGQLSSCPLIRTCILPDQAGLRIIRRKFRGCANDTVISFESPNGSAQFFWETVTGPSPKSFVKELPW